MYIKTYNCGFSSEINDYLVSSLVVCTCTLCLKSAYLPSSCGKVMFSQVCVIPSVHCGGCLPRAGGLYPGGSA